MQKQVENVEHDDDYHIDQHHGDDNDKNDHSVLMMMIMATQEGCKSTVEDHDSDNFNCTGDGQLCPNEKQL